MAVELSQADRREARELLGALVAIPSVNRGIEQGRVDQPEKQMAAFLAEYLGRIGMDVTVLQVEPGRGNVIAHWPDQRGRRSLLFDAHMDTVGVEGMTVEAFAARQDGGRVYGRGACDAKGPMAAFLTALRVARERGIEPADKIYFAATMGEEVGCIGARRLVESGFRCDGAVVGEPTACNIVAAHKGSVWLRLAARGRSCHAATPELGRNPIVPIARAVEIIESRFRPLLQARRHPLLGRATVSVNLVAGGTKVNVVPDRCGSEIDIRTLPEQRPQELIELLRRQLVEELPDWADDLELDCLWELPGMETPADAALVRNSLAVAGRYTGQGQPAGMPYFADSGPLRASGAEVVIFGPGQPAQAHTADEFIELDQLYLGAQIVLELLGAHQDRSVLD
ncbi:MAG: M20 family metallopeptidase [Phycisphaerae bacterium]